ncbi:MAG: Gfo/Idh/MocA family oxidoreductase, partial [Armatimonadota bacterium]
MAQYRSLLLGCGPRAVEHADVYSDIPNMEMVACCDLQQERTDEFQKRFDIPEAFDDYETALEAVQPDIVHIVTQPANRVWEVRCAADAGVK